MSVLFSIITVCYNADETLVDTIESVLNQTSHDFEYILIDGGSIDTSLEIIKSYERSFEEKQIPYRYLSEADGGMYEAMNKAIDLSKGTLIGILNSDDWYQGRTLETVAQLYNEVNAIGLYCGHMNRVDKNKKVYKTLKNPIDVGSVIKNKMPVNHPATFVHAEVYKSLGTFDTNYRLSADYDFIFRAYKAGIPFHFTSEVLTNMRNSGATGLLNNLWVTAKEDYQIRKKNAVIGAEFLYLKRAVFNLLIIFRAFLRNLG